MKLIIDNAFVMAMSLGIGVLTAISEDLEDHGYEMTEEIERYIFDTYVF